MCLAKAAELALTYSTAAISAGALGEAKGYGRRRAQRAIKAIGYLRTMSEAQLIKSGDPRNRGPDYLKLRQEGKSWREIGRLFGRDEASIRAAVARIGGMKPIVAGRVRDTQSGPDDPSDPESIRLWEAQRAARADKLSVRKIKAAEKLRNLTHWKKDYESGLSETKIALKYNVNPGYVNKVLKALGTRKRNRAAAVSFAMKKYHLEKRRAEQF
jgi:hypothetical protein